MNTIEKLIPILESKIEEGLDELKKCDIKSEEFTICFNNTLAAQDLYNRIMYKPAAPKKEDLETKTNS